MKHVNTKYTFYIVVKYIKRKLELSYCDKLKKKMLYNIVRYKWINKHCKHWRKKIYIARVVLAI